ncbi:MAG TPA: zinc-binding alcohol dehydrogenase family protein [Noviherbaspirillum sp.]|jgi:zinc-binding alcohol dehydrogenase family protein|uniref:zinc-binding alcohol dehydrogenase family protein n=1 Tax=Noviherbaspirillum sp. TaxID=1926288 RepID=UPI002F9394B1
MKAVALTRYLPIDHPQSLVDTELPVPRPGPRDLLVAVRAVAVNPVDTKVRAPKDGVEAAPRVLGWDAAGVVEAVGAEVALFRPGDRVYYAGDITRPGSNSEYQLVDERIVGHMPASLGFEQAAALPLTAITAWEALFERLKVAAPPRALPRKSILIIGGAGGVGSIAIQLAAKVAGLTVIATASRPASAKWVRELGAHHVVDHFGDIPLQLREAGFPTVDHVLVLNDTDRHFRAAAEAIAPQGTICTVVENRGPLDIGLLKSKSAALAWEMMFARSMYQTEDMIEQHRLLEEIARLVDSGIVRTTVTRVMAPISAANLREAHALVEGGSTIGKIVLKDF